MLNTILRLLGPDRPGPYFGVPPCAACAVSPDGRTPRSSRPYTRSLPRNRDCYKTQTGVAPIDVAGGGSVDVPLAASK